MPVPQQILDALNAVQGGADSVASALAADQAADAALTMATADKQGTAAAVSAAQAHLKTDLDALISLENTTYGG